MRKSLVLLVAAGITALSAGFPAAMVKVASVETAGVAAPARAHSWVAKIVARQASGEQHVLSIAEVGSAGGEKPVASGAPLTVGGESPFYASADSQHPDSVATPWTWNDSTGSGSAEGGFAEAHVVGDSAQVRAGLGSAAGSGFAVSSMTMSWEQQEELMNNWITTMDAIFIPLNAQMKAIEPALAPLGIIPPHFEQMAALGWVDVFKMRQVASNSETASSTEFSSARSTASIDELSMFSGFIQARGISTDAFSQSAAGSDERHATSTIRLLKIAGVPVVADSTGFRVARNDQASRTLLQPGLDVLMGALESAGVTLRVADARGEGDLRQAAALQLDITSPQGSLSFSFGYAEASAKSVGAAVWEDPDPKTPIDLGGDTIIDPVDTFDPVSDFDSGPVFDPGSGATPPASQGNQSTRRYFQRPAVLPMEAVRSLRTSYLLLFVVGGLLGATLVPLLARAPSVPVSRRGRI